MSKYQMIHNAPIAACAAILMSGLAVPASAQNAVTAPEQRFTIAPNVETPIVLQTQPDAACDLHLAGVTDPAQNMRLYANEEGYVRFHVRSKQDAEEVAGTTRLRSRGLSSPSPRRFCSHRGHAHAKGCHAGAARIASPACADGARSEIAFP
jgi:hypothetical protein